MKWASFLDNNDTYHGTQQFKFNLLLWTFHVKIDEDENLSKVRLQKRKRDNLSKIRRKNWNKEKEQPS